MTGLGFRHDEEGMWHMRWHRPLQAGLRALLTNNQFNPYLCCLCATYEVASSNFESQEHWLAPKHANEAEPSTAVRDIG